jgi:hypothetical protein
MHAWIGFVFSCVMIVVTAAGKSGYQWLPSSLAATPTMEFMFLIGCAGFGAALAMIAPSYSSARLASIWASAALGIVVVVLNLNNLNLRDNQQVVEVAPESAIVIPEAEEADEPPVNFVLKRTINEGEWQPFQDFDHRVRQFERAQPPASEDGELNHTPPQPGAE